MRRKGRGNGFSLIEVALALGVLTAGVLALIGLLAPLLHGERSGQASADTSALLELTTEWLAHESRRDFYGRHARLTGEPITLYLYLWENSAGEIAWKAAERSEAVADYDRYQRGQGAFAARLHQAKLVLDPAAIPPGNVSSSYAPLRATYRSLPPPDPARPFDSVEQTLDVLPPAFFAHFLFSR